MPLSVKTAMFVGVSGLSKNATGAQVSDDKLEQIGFWRIVANFGSRNFIPDLRSGDPRIVVDSSDNREVDLVITINPIDE